MKLTPISSQPDELRISATHRVVKADDERQILFGWASVAVGKDGTEIVDAHNDVIAIEDLEMAAYNFALEAMVSGEDHAGEVDAQVIESLVVTEDKLTALGLAKGTLPLGWWIGVHVPNRESYERAKSEKQMFSIEGTATREPIDGE